MSFLIVRILRQVHYDKRLLGLVFIAPLLVLTLVRFLLDSGEYTPRIGADMPLPFIAALQEQKAEVSPLNASEVDDLLKSKTIDAAVYLDGNTLTVKLLENDVSKIGAVTTAIQKALRSVSPGGPGDLTIQFIYGQSGDSLFDSMAHIMLGIVAFFFIFILSGVAFIRERSQGTLERFILSPIKRWQIIAGYTAAYGLLAAVQSTVILLYGSYVLGIDVGSAVPLAMLIMILMSVTAVSVGILVSTASNNEFQVVQFIPVLVLPQVFFSGLIPLDSMPYHLGTLSYIMPIYYACDALKHVMVYRSGITAIAGDLLVLVGLSLALSAISTSILKHYRKI